MEHLYKAYDMLDDKLEELTKEGDLKNIADVEAVDKLSHAMKSLKTIIAMCESEDGYSNTDGRTSYARGRGGRGRYSRESYPRYSRRRGYSMDDGVVEQLHDLMNEASSEKEKDAIRKVIGMIE